jgi:hypothetical protein
MNFITLSAADLLAGAENTFDLEIPTAFAKAPTADTRLIIKIRPLSIGTFSLIMRATKNDPTMMPLFMVKEGVVEPSLTVEQVKKLPIGLVEFIIDNLREISGLTKKKNH